MKDTAQIHKAELKINASAARGKARIQIETICADSGVTVELRILDREGETVGRAFGQNAELFLDGPHLWQGAEEPYLYRAAATLTKDGQFAGKVEKAFGIRSFSVDPQKGFFLNGRPYPLRGVIRRPSWEGRKAEEIRRLQVRDVELLCELGANLVRLSYCARDEYFCKLCDEKGILIWSELEAHEGEETGKLAERMEEMLRERGGYTSVAFWGLPGCLTRRGIKERRRQEICEQLQRLCREKDPGRMSVLACPTLCNPFRASLNQTDLIGWELRGDKTLAGLWANHLFLQFFHRKSPWRAVCIGACAAEEGRQDFVKRPGRSRDDQEGQARYHERIFRFLERYPFFWAICPGRLWDAKGAQEELAASEKAVKKDSFYFYKAHWSKTPFVHICGKQEHIRKGKSTVITAYTNLGEAELWLDGFLMEKKRGGHVFRFEVPLKEESRVEIWALGRRDVLMLFSAGGKGAAGS